MKTSKWKICQCSELECNKESFTDLDGKLQQGRAFSLTAFKTHQEKIAKHEHSIEGASTKGAVTLPETIQVSAVREMQYVSLLGMFV